MSKKDKTIPLKEAQNWTNAWRDKESGYNKHNKCNGFLVPIQDLQGVLNEMKDEKGEGFIRAYLGVDMELKMEKLIIVGTKPEIQKDGSIIYRDLVPEEGELQTGGGDVWDFTDPCPPACDPNSPLN